MGGHPYWYFVEYKSDINEALIELRNREFNAGRYNPAIWMPEFPISEETPKPGAKHNSIDEAREDAAEEGTRSILDIEMVSDKPDYCVAVPYDPEKLKSLFETTEPTHEMLVKNYEYFDEIERGHCIFIIVYKNNKPDEILFAGYSFD